MAFDDDLLKRFCYFIRDEGYSDIMLGAQRPACRRGCCGYEFVYINEDEITALINVFGSKERGISWDD